MGRRRTESALRVRAELIVAGGAIGEHQPEEESERDETADERDHANENADQHPGARFLQIVQSLDLGRQTDPQSRYREQTECPS